MGAILVHIDNLKNILNNYFKTKLHLPTEASMI